MTEILANVVPITYGAERVDFGRVKGAIIRAHLDWVRDFGSRAEIIALFEEIPDFLRFQISTLTPAAWYPFRTLITIDRLIVDRFGNGESRFARELGAWRSQPARLRLDRGIPSRVHSGSRRTSDRAGVRMPLPRR